MTVPSRCPSCGTPTKPNDLFCGACGADLVAQPAPSQPLAPSQLPPSSEQARRAPQPHTSPPAAATAGRGITSKKTMIGLAVASPAPQPAAPPPAGPAAPTSSAASPAAPLPPGKPALEGTAANAFGGAISPKKTMVGLSPVNIVTKPAPAAAVPSSAAASPRAPEGLAAPLPGGAGAEPPSTRPPPAVDLSPKRTMLGVAPPPALAQVIREATRASATGPAPSAPAVVKPAPEPAASAPVQPSAAAPSSLTVAGAGAKPAAKLPAQTDRTMLGLPYAAAPAEAAPATSSEPSEASAPYGADRDDSLSVSRASLDDIDRRSIEGAAGAGGRAEMSLLRRLLAALAGALFVLALGLAAFHFFGQSADIGLRVVQGEGSELLEVQVADAPPGTKVRFLGVEQELRGGSARFPLAPDVLALGDNELAIGVVRGARVSSTNVRLHVAYRARVDSSGLAREAPSVEVVIDALPGAKVTVDGEPLALDARGHGVKRYPVAAQTGTKLAFTARYRIEPKDGPVAEGALALNMPVTSLQIDRPGPVVTTDQAILEVAGAVEPGAKVSVEGQSVPVHDGRFLYRARLSKPGDYLLHVLARASGKAPRSLELRVTRVADLTLAAASFKADPALSYARIAQNPVIYRGQNIALDGRVYNVEVKSGESHLQMLVRDCPGAQRCPLWVELPQATEVTVDTWVRVLGTVVGEQQFRSERGQVHTVPSVRAQYVLKLAR